VKVFIVLMGLFLLVSCSLKSKGWWNEGVIAVMADSTDWEVLQGNLQRTFERVVRTPQPEKTFSLRYVSEEEFIRYTKFQYLLLVATLKSEGKVGKIVRNSISDPEIQKGMEEGKYYVFTQRNRWAKNQLMAILVAKDIPTLLEKIETNSDFLYAIYNADFENREKKEMFKRGEQKELERRLMTTYGWTMQMQRDYFLVQEFPNEGFVWFRRMYPERWIFVRWIDGGDTTFLNPGWVVKERNRIGSMYYGGDSVDERYFFSYASTFHGRNAQITSGLWQNNDKVAGGPFKNVTFYDPLSRRIYMIDVAVYAPQMEKLPYLRRLQIILNTFRTVFDQEESK